MQVFFILLTYRLPQNTAKAQRIQETFSFDLCKCIRLIFSQQLFVIIFLAQRVTSQ